MARIKAIFLASIATLFIVSLVFSGSQQTGSTTGTTIANKARYLLNESTAAFWTDTEMLQWINDGTLDIAAYTHCLEATETETLVTNTYEYAIAENYLVIKGVILDRGSGESPRYKALVKGNIRSFGAQQDIGEPVYWTHWEDNLLVYPAPNSSASGDSLTVYLVERPTEIDALASSILVPKHYENALALYVAMQGMLKDRQYEKANQLAEYYRLELDRFRVDFNEAPKKEEIEVEK